MTMGSEPTRGETILLADDDDVLRTQLSKALERRGFTVRACSGLDDAMLALENGAPDKAILDLRMGDGSGLDLLKHVSATCPSTQTVILTGYGSIATAVEAMRLGAVNYVAKPADARDVLEAFEKAERPPTSPTRRSHDAPSLARAEWEHINRVLADCGGNISKAARRLGIHRRTLQRKLEKFPPQT
ncbi:MAG: response regulator [Myxococcales bacterium]|nr:response regulator [Myxococcales bacterium]